MAPASERYDQRRQIRHVDELIIPFGRPVRFEGAEVAWNSRKAVNGHMLLAGPSGSGKSHQGRRIIGDLAAAGARRIIVIDVHGDLDVAGAHTVRFSETTEFGLNPLSISADRDFGGVRKRISAFVSMMNRTGYKLGPKQDATLRALLEDLYSWNGFWKDDPRTWSVDYDPRRAARREKTMPALPDLRWFIEAKFKQMRLGGGARAIAALEDLVRAVRSMQTKAVEVQKGNADPDALVKLKARCVELYAQGIENFETGRELEDMLKYDSVDTVKSLLDRIAVLEGAGIFRGKAPPFDHRKTIWRYDIKALSRDEMILFVDCLLEQLFFEAKQSGEADGPDSFIYIDEASIFVNDDADHILNVLAREVRKFGWGIILANQHMLDYTDDILMSAAVKIILGVEEMFQEPMRRRLGLEMVDLAKTGRHAARKANPLSFIRPRNTAMVAVKNHGASGRMVEVAIRA